MVSLLYRHQTFAAIDAGDGNIKSIFINDMRIQQNSSVCLCFQTIAAPPAASVAVTQPVVPAAAPQPAVAPSQPQIQPAANSSALLADVFAPAPGATGAPNSQSNNEFQANFANFSDLKPTSQPAPVSQPTGTTITKLSHTLHCSFHFVI